VTSVRFPNQLRLLGWRIYTQRVVRFALRGLWVGAAMYLIIWAVGVLAGLPALERNLCWLSLAAGALFVAAGIRRVPQLEKLAWSADRALGLNEVLSSGLKVSTEAREDPLAVALMEDAGKSLGGVSQRVMAHGWSLKKDLEALLIVAILGTVAFGTPSLNRPRFGAYEVEPMMPLGEDPRAMDIFPAGLPGLRAPGATGVSEVAADLDSRPSIGAGDVGQLLSALADFGSELREIAATANAGAALQRGDLSEAVKELETVADTIADNPPETNKAIREALESAATRVDQMGASGLSEAMASASEALGSGEPVDKATSMAEVASELHELASSIDSTLSQSDRNKPGNQGNQPSDSNGSGGGGGSGVGGAASVVRSTVPMRRLEGAGNMFSVEGGSEAPGAVTPGQETESQSTNVVQGDFGAVTAGSEGTAMSPIAPIHYLWEFARVVAGFFSRR
jgi:hypothetical protein